MAATGDDVVLFPPDLELALCRDLLLSGHTARKHAQSVCELHAFLTRNYTFEPAQPVYSVGASPEQQGPWMRTCTHVTRACRGTYPPCKSLQSGW